jgi:hypothetical protein
LLCRTERNAPDVLLLYDSYYPAYSGECKQGHAVVELIAAYGEPDSFVTRTGFPEILADVLTTAASEGIPISIPELYAALLQRFQDIADKIKGKSISDLSKRFSKLGSRDEPAYSLSQQPLPVHAPFGRDVTPRSIMLAPLRNKKSTFASGIPAATSTRVLLAVHIEESRYDEGAFKEWILRAPAAAKRIFISAVKPSYSTLLLVEMPVEVWTALEPSPALSFVGFLREDGGHGSRSRMDTIESSAIPWSFGGEPAVVTSQLSSRAFETWPRGSKERDERGLDDVFGEIDDQVRTALRHSTSEDGQGNAKITPEAVLKLVFDALERKYGREPFGNAEQVSAFLFQNLHYVQHDARMITVHSTQLLIIEYVSAKAFALNPLTPPFVRRRFAPLFAWLDEEKDLPEDAMSFVSGSQVFGYETASQSRMPSIFSMSASRYSTSTYGITSADVSVPVKLL